MKKKMLLRSTSLKIWTHDDKWFHWILNNFARCRHFCGSFPRATRILRLLEFELSTARLLRCQTIRVYFSLVSYKNYFLFTHRPISRLKKNNRAKKELAQRLSTNTVVRLLRVRWYCCETQQKCKVKHKKKFYSTRALSMYFRPAFAP